MQDVLVNGIKTDQVNSADRGVCYGDGLFETVAVINGVPQLLEQHLQRLSLGLIRLGFPTGVLPLITSDLKLLTFTGNQVLKITITRGLGPRGYAPSAEAAVTRIISLSDYVANKANAQNGVTLRHCQYQLPINPVLAEIKHLNRLDQVMARSEWNEPDTVEGLVTDTQGYLVEGTMSNVFWIANHELCTPSIDRCGVKGVMRDHLLEIATAEGLKCRIDRFYPDALIQASELFICNSLIGIWPVVNIGDQKYDIGPVTRRLQDLLTQESK